MISKTILQTTTACDFYYDWTKGWRPGKNSMFSEYGHCTFSIKGDEAYSYRVANICPPPHTHTHDPRGWVQKVKTIFFLKLVMLYIKLKGKECRKPLKQIFFPYANRWPFGYHPVLFIICILVQVVYIKPCL